MDALGARMSCEMKCIAWSRCCSARRISVRSTRVSSQPALARLVKGLHCTNRLRPWASVPSACSGRVPCCKAAWVTIGASVPDSTRSASRSTTDSPCREGWVVPPRCWRAAWLASRISPSGAQTMVGEGSCCRLSLTNLCRLRNWRDARSTALMRRSRKSAESPGRLRKRMARPWRCRFSISSRRKCAAALRRRQLHSG